MIRTDKGAEVLLERRNRFGTYLNVWLELPASRMEIDDALQRIKSEAPNDYEIVSFSSPLTFKLPKNARLDELNYLAARLAIMDESQEDYMQYFVEFEKSPPDMKRLINMTFNPDYLVVYAACDYECMGEVHIDELVEKLPDYVYDWLDMEKVGRYVEKKQGGKLFPVSGMYAYRTGKEFVEVYDGTTLPPVMDLLDEDDYVFKLLVAPPSEADSAEVEDMAMWLTLPGDENEIDRIAKQMQQAGIEDCVYLRMLSAIPQINSDIFGDMVDFDVLHDIARRYADMDADEKMHYKAALTLSNPKTISGCRYVLDTLSKYGWRRDWDALGDIGHQYAIDNMGLTAEQASHVNADAIGKACMLSHRDYKITDYGTVWLDRSPQLSETQGYEKTDGLRYSQSADGNGDEVERCQQFCKERGVRVRDTMDDYDALLEELGTRMCDEGESQEQGMGGLT